MKITSVIGKPMKTDRGNAMRDLLHYARILVEVSIDDDLLESISFENEWGVSSMDSQGGQEATRRPRKEPTDQNIPIENMFDMLQTDMREPIAQPGTSGFQPGQDTMQGRGDDGNYMQGEAGGGNPHQNHE